MGDKPAAKPQPSAGMWGCCRNMAMMGGQRGGQGGGMQMPGMEPPKPQ